MTRADSPQRGVLNNGPWKPVGWLIKALGVLGRMLLLAWATLAIYFSNLPWAWARLVLAIAFAAFGVWALWLTRKPRMSWAFAGSSGCSSGGASFCLRTIDSGVPTWR